MRKYLILEDDGRIMIGEPQKSSTGSLTIPLDENINVTELLRMLIDKENHLSKALEWIYINECIEDEATDYVPIYGDCADDDINIILQSIPKQKERETVNVTLHRRRTRN